MVKEIAVGVAISVLGGVAFAIFQARYPNASTELLVGIFLVVLLLLLGRWDLLPDWIHRQQIDDQLTTLGSLQPPKADPPLTAMTPGPAPEVVKTNDSVLAVLELVAPEKKIDNLIAFGTDTLLYADLSNAQTIWSFDSWRDRTEQWKDHVFEALGELGASAEEKTYIQDLGEFTKRKLPGIHEEHAKLRERLAERIKRLREILERRKRPYLSTSLNRLDRPRF